MDYIPGFTLNKYLQYMKRRFPSWFFCFWFERLSRKKFPSGDFRKMDMRSLCFPKDYFDGVWANSCIHHVPKKEFLKVLKEVYRVLRLKGIFSFNFKIGEGEALEKNPKTYGEAPRYYSYYSIKEMEELLMKNGFDTMDFKLYPMKLFGYRFVCFWANKK